MRRRPSGAGDEGGVGWQGWGMQRDLRRRSGRVGNAPSEVDLLARLVTALCQNGRNGR
jgi:hypothetical protein